MFVGSSTRCIGGTGLGLSICKRLKRLHILVAEDHPVNRVLLSQILDAEGASMACACDGAEAVSLVNEALIAGARRFDAVLCDIEMPVMDGIEATRRMCEIAPGLPIIGLTAHAFDDARRRGSQSGMIDYLTKPYMVDDLVRMVRRHASPAPATSSAHWPSTLKRPR